METTDLFNERNETHGSFVDNARVAQSLKRVLHTQDNWGEMNDLHKEALDLICTKIGRIMSGQADFDDHYEDIAGYAKLPQKFNHGND